MTHHQPKAPDSPRSGQASATVWQVSVNAPGYLPDCSPGRFDTYDEAFRVLVAELDHTREVMGDGRELPDLTSFKSGTVVFGGLAHSLEPVR